MSAVVGVADHGGWAILVSVAADGTMLDRRRVDLVDDSLPAIPHHHEAAALPLAQGVALVERVRASAEKHSAIALDALAKDVPAITGIALRICPVLPSTIAECLQDTYARNNADWVMYRKVLASAAETRGWHVHWFDAKTLDLSVADAMRKSVGPPWNTDYKTAYAAALANSKLQSIRTEKPA